MSSSTFLDEPLPADPMPTFALWLQAAREKALQPNPDAMVLATVDEHCQPSARVVLCKRLVIDAGYLVFFTNYRSRKARELDARACAAAVFHWDALHRQVRVEGRIMRSPVQESDEYFASRALNSRLGAWASDQSLPLASRQELADRILAATSRFGLTPDATQGEVPRPPHWGGFRLWIELVELWVEGPGRVHDRAVWKRTLAPRDEFSFAATDWVSTRLYT